MAASAVIRQLLTGGVSGMQRTRACPKAIVISSVVERSPRSAAHPLRDSSIPLRFTRNDRKFFVIPP